MTTQKSRDEKRARNVYPEGTVSDAILRSAYVSGIRAERRRVVAVVKRLKIEGNDSNLFYRREILEAIKGDRG